MKKLAINKEIMIGDTGLSLADLQGKVLWTNPNPTSSFSSQSINLSSNDYDELVWYFLSDTSLPMTFTTISLKSRGSQVMYSSTVSFKLWVRRITYNSITNFTISDCSVITSSGISNSNNSLIPIKVVGYKYKRS